MEVVLSGNFSILSRDEISRRVAELGSHISPSFSKKTSLLCIGQDPKELKRSEAQLLGIPIIAEKSFIQMLKSGKLTTDVLLTAHISNNTTTTTVSNNKENQRRPSPSNNHTTSLKRKHNKITSPQTTRSFNTSKRAKKEDSSNIEQQQQQQQQQQEKEKENEESEQSLTTEENEIISSEEELEQQNHHQNNIEGQEPGTSNSNNNTANNKPKMRMVAAQNRQTQTTTPALNKALLKKVIALEGQIGVGKSTLSQKMMKKYGELCGVYEEQTNEGFLKLFYGNPAKYGFAFQWGMLKTRIYQLKLAQHDQLTSTKPSNKFFVWDRSMIGDYIFALWNHLLGSISIEEMQVYESEFGGSILTLEKIPFLSNIHIFVFLNDEPSNCKYRVEEHRKNESEQGIPLPYYVGIDDIHFSILLSLLSKKAAKAMVVNWGEYEDSVKVLANAGQVVENKKSTPVVEYLSKKPSANQLSNDEHSIHYANESQINASYELIKNGNTKSIKSSIQNVYLPKNIMTVDPSTKDVKELHRQRYQIQFYENAYKRVVMWHLSQFHNIYFY